MKNQTQPFPRMLGVAVALCLMLGFGYGIRQAASQEAPAVTADPPIAPGTADELEARMRARRQIQQADGGAQPAVQPGFGGGSIAGGEGLPPGRRGFGPAAQPMSDENNPAVLKKRAPVFTGIDPTKIEESDKIITQIIPLQNIPAVQVRNDLGPLLSADADTTANANSNCIIITDTSSKVRRIVEILQTLEKQASGRPPAPPGRNAMNNARGPWRIPVPSPAADGALDTRGVLSLAIAEITTPVDGTLAEIAAHDGASVKKGDLLYKFDAGRIAAEVEQLKAQLQLTQHELSQAIAEAAKPDAITQKKLQLAAQEATIRARELELDAYSVHAPFDGTVTSDRSVNTLLKPDQFVTRGTTLSLLVDTGEMTVDFLVAAKDASALHPGETFTFRALSGPDGDFPGEITAISPLVEHMSDMVQTATTEKTVDVETVAIRGRLTKKIEGLRSGMTGDVKISIGK